MQTHLAQLNRKPNTGVRLGTGMPVSGVRHYWRGAAAWQAAVLLLMATAGFSSLAAVMKNSDCMDCHGDTTLAVTNSAGAKASLYVSLAALTNSVHATNACVACHDDIKGAHPDDNVHAKKVD